MMTTAPRREDLSGSDSRLWQLACHGSDSAFEVLVRRYQSLVCSVAYSACGNLALSEDVAQETFWTAWRQRTSLRDPDRLSAWLCGIARNLAKNARRKALRPADSTQGLDALAGISTTEPGPPEEAVTREEESLVWQALQEVPEAYREPLILFYREDQSIAEVATALVLSEDAVKQRLSRGRGMLREKVAELVEGALRRSRPGGRFTLTVMTGLAAQAAVPKAAVAGAGAGAAAAGWNAAGAAGAAGTIGSILGSLGGLLGGWLGTWLGTRLPAEAAPTLRERDALLRAGRRMLMAFVVFSLALFGLVYALAGTPGYLIGWVGLMVAFASYVVVQSVRLTRELIRIRAEPLPGDAPNDTAIRARWAALGARFGDRVYRSDAKLLGLPLIDINLSAPMPPEAGKPVDSSVTEAGPRIARGWIAIGDDAGGVLLAIGSRARGLVALGGRAFGVLSCGGLALGLVAIGGLGLGVLGIGGLGAGVYALGGGAVGWRAVGGLALGWDMACGGGAFAHHAAIGGAAVARDYAVGGDARALHANDDAARSYLLEHPFTRFALAAMGQRQLLAQLAGAGAAQVSEPAPAEAPGSFHLDNGMAVRIRPIQGTESVALLVLYRIGGDHDPQGRSGLAHLVEHVYVTAAAGSEPARTAQAFFQHYRAGCNAQTGDRYTVFATVFPKADLDKELADAADRMGNLRVTAADLDREKPRLLDEVGNMFGRIPALGAVNNAREQIRPTPRGGRKGGLSEHVRAITLDEVQTYWKRYYKPRNALLVLAGAVDEPAARQAVKSHFATIERGEEIPAPGESGSPREGTVRELSVKTLQPQTMPSACLAYAAPAPGSELYAPFLIFVARFYAASAQAGAAAAPDRPSVYYPLLEDPAVVGVSAGVKAGETSPEAVARLESFVAATTAPPLRDEERASAHQMFAFFLATTDLPDFALAQNPYGAALALARREQLGLDPRKLGQAIDALTEQSLRRAATEIFAPSRHAGAIVSPEK